jgi:hypothetical protein
MDKATFLQEAKAKYVKRNEKVTSGADWVSEMNFIYSPQLILRVWFDHTIDAPKGAMCHRWCTVENLGDETIFNKFDEFLCEDNEDFPLILLALKKALKKDKAKMIDHLEYKKGVSITPIENFEFTFTVEAFCEAVGIES